MIEGRGLRSGDDDLGVYELLVELGVLALLVGGGDEGVTLVLEPLADAELILSCAEKLRDLKKRVGSACYSQENVCIPISSTGSAATVAVAGCRCRGESEDVSRCKSLFGGSRQHCGAARGSAESSPNRSAAAEVTGVAVTPQWAIGDVILTGT